MKRICPNGHLFACLTPYMCKHLVPHEDDDICKTTAGKCPKCISAESVIGKKQVIKNWTRVFIGS